MLGVILWLGCDLILWLGCGSYSESTEASLAKAFVIFTCQDMEGILMIVCITLISLLRYYEYFISSGYEEEKRKRRLQIKSRPMFSDTSDKNQDRFSFLEKTRRLALSCGANSLTGIFTKHDKDLGVKRRHSNGLNEKGCSAKKNKKGIDRTATSGTSNDNSSGNEESLKFKTELREQEIKDHSKEGTCKTIKLNEDKNGQLRVNPEALHGKKSLVLSADSCCKKANRYNDDVPQNDASKLDYSKNSLKERPFFSKKEKVSLVSELYVDTDSDSSK